MIASDITDITAIDIASKNIFYLNKGSVVGDAVSELRNRRIHNVLVCSGKKYTGVFGYRQLFRLYGRPLKKTDIMPYISRPPVISPETKLPQVADYMYRLDFKLIPIGEDKSVSGIISESDILEKALQSGMFKDIRAKDIMSLKPVTIRDTETLGKGLQLMRENDISRLPVLDINEKVIGLVDSMDFVERMLSKKESYGELIEISPSQKGSTVEGEAYAPSEISDKDISISALMRTDMTFGNPDDPVEGLFTPKATKEISTVLIEENGSLVGILSPKDIVRHISALAEKKKMLVWISGIRGLDFSDFEVRELYRMLEETAAKLSKKIKINTFSIYVKRYRVSGKRAKYSLRCRLTTARDVFTASYSGWDIRDAFGQLMDNTERMVIESWDKKRKDTQESRRKSVYFEGVD